LLVVGEWDECARLADEAISQSETLGPHYLDAQAYFARSLLSMARERIDAALVNQRACLASARRAKDPQVLYSTLASSAYVLAEAGHLDESRALLDELLHTADPDETDIFAYAGPEVALMAETIGRREELRLWLGPALGSAWTQAARAILADDFAQALSLIEPMGAIFTASVIRLRAGKHLIQQGQRDEAQAMLQPAITFFKSVGATHYLRTAQALLAA